MHDPPVTDGGVKSDETLFAILDVLKNEGWAHVSEIATEIGVANSTVHRHLQSLHDNEFVVKEDGAYRLGYRFLELGAAVRSNDHLIREVKTVITDLAIESGESSLFMVEEHGRGVIVYQETGSNVDRMQPHCGLRVPLHAFAAGKAVLAALPNKRVREIIHQRGLEAVSSQSITDEDTLFTELERIRETGIAYNHGENMEVVRGVGATVTRPDGEVLGGVSISGPMHRMKGKRFTRELPELIQGTIGEFEILATHG
ncbi:IclR family transcriptional regulator [Halogeometricum luteum]|uniref:IclR family transcriptional regulator n=1 Tax=Halogeometricum luteum TaxID=2950537 RepID=A0ABU2G3K4_9EURY|nr:IclR family transcriptional regulator [Halogeometricum sp. S3BR5-2]MDS0295364.1 IclR family transcriptional regulator [Halogeometricum sp. S3BR5-2]